MTTRHQIHGEKYAFYALAAAMGVIFAFYAGNKIYHPKTVSMPLYQAMQTQSSASTPTVTSAPQPQVTSQVTPDGKKKLTMTVTVNKDLSKTYTFVTSDSDESNQHTVYSATYTDDTMSIPFNTWSPDNKYLFVLHTSATGSDAIVMRSGGDAITATESNLNVTELFKSKITNNIYDETTGWASETLLIINTKTPDGTKSTSYWFEVPSKAIIPLSTQF